MSDASNSLPADIDLGTNCRYEDSGTELGFKSGIYAAVTTKADLFLYALENVGRPSSDIAMDFAEGYHEAMLASDDGVLKVWPQLPNGCDGCDFVSRCYETSGKGYTFKS